MFHDHILGVKAPRLAGPAGLVFNEYLSMGNVRGLRAVNRLESAGRLESVGRNSVDGYGLADDLWVADMLEVVDRLRIDNRLGFIDEHRTGGVFDDSNRLRIANTFRVGYLAVVDKLRFSDKLRAADRFFADQLRFVNWFTNRLRVLNRFGVADRPEFVDRIRAGS